VYREREKEHMPSPLEVLQVGDTIASVQKSMLTVATSTTFAHVIHIHGGDRRLAEVVFSFDSGL